ncbi:MAG TPA: DUF6531 domain-containing protein, partial [Chloroflexota bacterium]|nr:DUF6531 domain-containing protein [Chloroflexota bacterium]
MPRSKQRFSGKRFRSTASSAIRLWLSSILLFGPGTAGGHVAHEAARRVIPAVVAVAVGMTAAAVVGKRSTVAPAQAAGPSGTVWAFGNNWEGQIGNGTTGNSAPPTQVSGLSDVVDISAAPFHSLVLKADGTVWGWGDNDAGQLGDGTTTRQTSPVQAQGLTNVSSLADAGHHTVVGRSDGTVWSWGRNEAGQLGHPSSSTCTWDDRNGPKTGPCSLTPAQVVGPGGSGFLTGIATRPGGVAAGAVHTLALKNDGTVWAWGDDSFEQLGADPTETCTHQNGQSWPCSRTPIQVKGPGGQGYLTDIVMVGAGWFYSLALKSDGTVYAWGENGLGQIGNGTNGGNVFYPTQVIGPGGSGTLSGIRTIAVGRGRSLDGGDSHTLALHDSGVVYAWGRNDVGQLGAPTTQTCTFAGLQMPCSRYPIQVQTISDIVHISAGRYHSLAVQQDGTPWGWGRNEWGLLAHTSSQTCTLDNSTFPCSKTPQQMSDLLTAAGTVSLLSGGQDHTLALAGMPSGMRLEPIPAGTEHNAPLINQQTSRFGVHTLTGHLIASGPSGAESLGAVAGRGPLPRINLTYNSNDTVARPLGPGWTHNYLTRLVDPGDNTGDVVLVGPQGRRDRYVKQTDGSYRGPADVRTQLTKQGSGTFVARFKDQSKWEFDAAGRLSVVADRHGNQSYLSYDASDRLAYVSDPVNRGSLSLTYAAASGRLTQVADWSGRVVQFEYDPNGRLQKIVDADGNPTTYAYDGTSHRLSTVTDARNVTVLSTSYDPNTGKVTSQQDAANKQTTYSYPASAGAPTVVTSPATSIEPGWTAKEEHTYSAEGRLTKRTTKPESNTATHATTQIEHDAAGNTTAVITPKLDRATLCYDKDYAGQTIAGNAHNLTRRIDPAPGGGQAPLVTLFKYDAKHNLIETISPKGVNNGTTVDCTTNLSTSLNTTYATTVTYDASQTKVLAVTQRYTDPELGLQTATTKYEYTDTNHPDRPTKVIPPRGNTGSTPDYSYATTYTYFSSG